MLFSSRSHSPFIMVLMLPTPSSSVFTLFFCIFLWYRCVVNVRMIMLFCPKIYIISHNCDILPTSNHNTLLLTKFVDSWIKVRIILKGKIANSCFVFWSIPIFHICKEWKPPCHHWYIWPCPNNKESSVIIKTPNYPNW